MWWHLARRLQLSPWESSVVNRLLTPTHSFLARSKSTAALSGDTGKTVKVPLSWWGKVFLLKHTWATPVHPITSRSSSVCSPSLCLGAVALEMSVGVGFMLLVPFPLRILSGHQMLGRQRMPLLGIQWLWMLLRVCSVTRKTYPFPAFLSAPASEQTIGGRHNLIFNTNRWAGDWNQSPGRFKQEIHDVAVG